MTDAERRKAINTLIDQIDACTRACHDRDDAALANALDDLVIKTTLFRERVNETRKKVGS